MKKLLALLLAMVMTLALAACGGGNNPPAENPEPPVSSDADTPPAEDTEPEEEPAEEPEITAIPLQCGGSIDNDNFCMTFDSVELLSEYSYKTSEYSSTSLYVEDGYKIVVVKGHFKNKATGAISDSAFSLSALVNGTYAVDGHDVRFNFIRDKYFEIDAYTDLDYVLYINIPEKLADMFETVDFTIGFNNDLSSPVTVWNSDGTTTVETDQLYVLTSGISSGEASTGGDGEAAPAGQDSQTSGIWKVNYYVDNFNQPTDHWYISTDNDFSGTFSNSATTNSKLSAMVAADYEGNISFFLWEYGRSQVKNSSERNVDEYNITMRTPDGTDHELTGTIYCGGDRLFIDDEYINDVLTAMQGDGTISFYIVQADRTTTTYLFSIEASNFASVYESVAG